MKEYENVDGVLEVTEPVVTKISVEFVKERIDFIQAQIDPLNVEMKEYQALLTKCDDLGVVEKEPEEAPAPAPEEVIPEETTPIE